MVVVVVIGRRQVVLYINVAVHVTDAVHVVQVIAGIHHLLVLLQAARGLGLQDHFFHGERYNGLVFCFLVGNRSWREKQMFFFKEFILKLTVIYSLHEQPLAVLRLASHLLVLVVGHLVVAVGYGDAMEVAHLHNVRVRDLYLAHYVLIRAHLMGRVDSVNVGNTKKTNCAVLLEQKGALPPPPPPHAQTKCVCASQRGRTFLRLSIQWLGRVSRWRRTKQSAQRCQTEPQQLCKHAAGLFTRCKTMRRRSLRNIGVAAEPNPGTDTWQRAGRIEQAETMDRRAKLSI